MPHETEENASEVGNAVCATLRNVPWNAIIFV